MESEKEKPGPEEEKTEVVIVVEIGLAAEKQKAGKKKEVDKLKKYVLDKIGTIGLKVVRIGVR